MKYALMAVSFVALALTVGPAFMVWQGGLPWNTHANLMLAGTLLWFATAPFWMKKEEEDRGERSEERGGEEEREVRREEERRREK